MDGYANHWRMVDGCARRGADGRLAPRTRSRGSAMPPSALYCAFLLSIGDETMSSSERDYVSPLYTRHTGRDVEVRFVQSKLAVRETTS